MITLDSKIRQLRESILDLENLPTHAEIKSHLEKLSETELFDLFFGSSIYEIFNQEFVSELAILLKDLHGKCDETKPIIEVCSGNGKLAYHLKKKGIQIKATDDYSFEDIEISENLVEKLKSHEALENYNPDIVVASWIPANSLISVDIVTYPSVKYLILIGELGRGCCGSKEIYDMTKFRWIDEVSRYSTSRSKHSGVELFEKL